MGASRVDTRPEREVALEALLRNQRSRPRVRHSASDRRARALRRLLVIADLAAIAFSYAIVFRILPLNQPLGGASPAAETAVLLGFLPVWTVLASLQGLYHLSNRRYDYSISDEIGGITMLATAWSWGLLIARSVITDGPLPVLPSLLAWAMAIGGIVLARILTRVAFNHVDAYRQRAVVLGTSEDANRITRRLLRHPEYGIDVVAVSELHPFDRRLSRRRFEPGERHEASDLRDSIDRVVAHVESLALEFRVDRAIVASPSNNLVERSAIVRVLTSRNISVDLISAEADSMPSGTVLHHVEGLPVLTAPPYSVSRVAYGFKRLVDVAVAAAGMLVALPLFAYCAIRVKLDSDGPVFFRQERVGRGGASFELLKFRSMAQDAEDRKHEVSTLNAHREFDGGKMFKAPEDPRITAFGRWMRRWSVDELPQLVNVIRGDMGIVGPRPLVPEEASLVGEDFDARSRIRPGITGPWQVSGRSDIGFDDMIKLDFAYARTWTFSGDFKILLRTAGAIVGARGAY